LLRRHEADPDRHRHAQHDKPETGHNVDSRRRDRLMRATAPPGDVDPDWPRRIRAEKTAVTPRSAPDAPRKPGLDAGAGRHDISHRPLPPIFATTAPVAPPVADHPAKRRRKPAPPG
jgi:hypothetical protein